MWFKVKLRVKKKKKKKKMIETQLLVVNVIQDKKKNK